MKADTLPRPIVKPIDAATIDETEKATAQPKLAARLRRAGNSLVGLNLGDRVEPTFTTERRLDAHRRAELQFTLVIGTSIARIQTVPSIST